MYCKHHALSFVQLEYLLLQIAHSLKILSELIVVLHFSGICKVQNHLLETNDKCGLILGDIRMNVFFTQVAAKFKNVFVDIM